MFELEDYYNAMDKTKKGVEDLVFQSERPNRISMTRPMFIEIVVDQLLTEFINFNDSVSKRYQNYSKVHLTL